MPFPRPRISIQVLIALCLLFLVATANGVFFRKGLEIFDGHEAWFALLVFGMFCASFAGSLLISWRFIFKPVYALLFLIAAAASYFAETYGVIIDRNMIENAITTTSAEAAPLITPAFLMHMTIFGVIPALLLFFVRIKRAPLLKTLALNTALFVASLGTTFAVMASNYAEYASILRERHDLVDSLMPAGPMANTVRYAVVAYRESHVIAAHPVGMDARFSKTIAEADKPVLIVLVVGETARAADFQINGYERETTPRLMQSGAISFRKAISCGTATAVSLPCMFSPQAREEFGSFTADPYENTLDVLKHAGADLRWWDVNTGSKGVARNIPEINFSAYDDPDHCIDRVCNDSILLKPFEERLEAIANGGPHVSVIVMHQIGSHGPAYWMRHPKGFAPFAPECRTAQFADCTPEEIRNGYDNSIAYTDFILTEITSRLEARGDIASAMLYVSDHGESLGENGLYLHGAPYFIAPEEQTHIPWIMWFSDAYKSLTELDPDCLDLEADISHDNYYDTVLGLAEIQSADYHRDRDILAACREGAQIAHQAATGLNAN